MSSVYRKISNIFQRSNHDQHDIMDYYHDHETPMGFIKIDNQVIFTQKFAKKFIQVYEGMVNVLKHLKDIKRGKMDSTSEKTMTKREFLPQLFLTPPLNEHLNFLIPKNMEELVKSLNRSNMRFVPSSEPIMTGILQKP